MEKLVDCLHGGLILAKTKGEFSNPNIKMYICLKCGKPFLTYDVPDFRDDEEALEIFKRMASEIVLPRLPHK
jgi:hypothetical protein